eukprot:85226_1
MKSSPLSPLLPRTKSINSLLSDDQNKAAFAANKSQKYFETEEKKNDCKEEMIDFHNISATKQPVKNSNDEDEIICKKIRSIAQVKTYLEHFLPPNISLSTVITSFIITPMLLLLNT